GVFTFGDAGFFGSAGDQRLNRPVVAMAPTPSGRGYWLAASDGGVFTFGDATFFGSTAALALRSPVVAMAPTPTGRGYWLGAADGGVFTFGDADFLGSAASVRLDRPIVALAPTPSGQGYWLAAADGGIFTFGDGAFLGSMGGTRLARPTVGLAITPRAMGYWIAAADGGVFTFGGAGFEGSAGGLPLKAPIVAAAAAPVLVRAETSVFYYPWWGTPAVDGSWVEWAAGGRTPPIDIAADFYPARGVYSSQDPAVLAAQMAEIRAAGIDEVASSWWGRGSFEDRHLALLVKATADRGLRLAVLLEPYAGRSPATVAADIAHLRATHGITRFYLYEADRSPVEGWAAITPGLSGVLVHAQSGNRTSMLSGAFAGFVRQAGFDGLFTYDAVRYSAADLATVCAGARQRGLRCAPSVAPQYRATRQKPNDQRVVSPQGGARYDGLWDGALAAGADTVTITSYNEWHEGTQIEGARPYCFADGHCSPGYDGVYGRVGPAADRAFLDRTAVWAALFRDARPA
ncbi:MAG: hypothetical protein ACRD0D_15345, partial [Acidimicrobiales bacterium]